MAGLDTSIALGIKPVDFGDPNEARMNALRSQLVQQQMQMGQFNMMKAQREMDYQDQQRAQAAAARAKAEAARNDFLKAYGATGTANVTIPAQVAEPGAASDVGMLGSKNAMTAYQPSSMTVNQPKDINAAVNSLIQGGKFDAANVGLGYGNAVNEAEKKKFELKKAEGEAGKVDADLIDKNLGTFHSFASTVNSPEAAAAYTAALFDHPVLGSVAQKISGQTKDQAMAAAANDFATNPQGWIAAHVGLKGKDVVEALAPKETTKIPELKKGERWNEETQRVEAVPGSSEYVAQAGKHEKDYKGILNVEQGVKGAEKVIGDLLDPKNAEGFNNSFGGYGAYLTGRASGNTATVQSLLSQLQSIFKQGGLQQFRQGGSIGAMTEKEWPIVADMIGSINPKMDPADVKVALQAALNKLRATRDTEREAYDTTWGQTQYHKPGATGGDKPPLSSFNR